MKPLTSYGSWALVTGASAGIGETFARRVAAQGVNVALVARRGERLRALAAEIERAHGVRTRVVVQDLEADDAADRIAEQVRDLEIGMLVNNAGFSAVGRFDRVPREKLLAMIRVNCLAVTALTHAFLPAMQARRRGAIVIVASVAGYQPLGLSATYAATKAFDLMLGEALWAENRTTGVDVLVLSPGPVETEFQAVAGETPHAGASPESVVDAAFGALGRKPSVVAGPFNKVRAWSVRLVPRAALARLALRVMSGFVPAAMR
jgi:short-subunit dehydrogenase